MDLFTVELWWYKGSVGAFVNGRLKADYELTDGTWYHTHINAQPYNRPVDYFPGIKRCTNLMLKLYKVPPYEPR